MFFFDFDLLFVSLRLLKGADALQLEKPIKQELGGGFKVFLFDELDFYEGFSLINIGNSLNLRFYLQVFKTKRNFSLRKNDSRSFNIFSFQFEWLNR